jgi:chemotaxis protein MotB
LQARLTATLDSLNATETASDTLRADLEAAQSELTLEEAARITALARAEQLAQELAAIENRLTEEAALRVAAQARAEELAAAQEDGAQAQANLRTQIQTLEADLSDAERARLAEAAAAEALRERLAQTEGALNEEERARLADVAAAEALRARLEEADAELTALTLALEEERARAEETLTLLAAARSAQDDLEAELDREISDRERVAALLSLARSTLAEQDAASTEDARQLEVLNQQVSALRGQVGGLQDLLGEARARAEAADTQIKSLGSELNLALAELAAEQKARADLEAAERRRLERFQSEFFGRLRDVLEGRDEIQVVGDRFVFSSEVLFELGSAELSDAGRAQIANVVRILREVSDRIPPDIDWILRVDGHTDNLALAPGAEFADNWELSQERALSVVRFMTDSLGFPPERLAATGFGEYRPVNTANTPEARAQNRRIELKLTER